MKIGILGASGFVGGNLMSYFYKNNYRVLGISRSKSELLKKEVTELIQIHELKALDLKLEQLLEDVDTVIDCAGTANPYNLEYYSLNELFLHSVSTLRARLDAIKKLNIKKYIYISSGGALYGESKKPLTESMLPMPSSKYGLMKQIEESLINYEQRKSSVNFHIIRVSNPYGPLHPLTKKQGVINVFARKILLSQKIQIWGNPKKSTKDYIYIDVLCSAIEKLCTSTSNQTTFNIGSSVQTNLSEILSILEDECGVPISCEFINKNAQDTSSFVLDTEKFRTNISDIQNISLREGIIKTLQWYNTLQLRTFA